MFMRPFFLTAQWILLFLIFNPFFFTLFVSNYTTYDLQRMMQLLLLALMTLHLCLDTDFRKHSFNCLETLCSYKKCLILVFFGLGVLSALHALLPRYALMEVGTFFCLMIFMFTIAGWYYLQKELFWQSFLLFLFLTFTISAFTSLGSFAFFSLNTGIMDFQDRTLLTLLTSPGYMNLRFFDDVQAFLIPLLITLFFYMPQKWQRILVFLLITFSITRGILGGSRLYLYEAIALFILLPLLFRRKALPYLVVLLGGIICGFILYILLYKSGLTNHNIASSINLLNGKGIGSLDNRGLLWQIAVQLIILRPLLGVGPLHYGLYAYAIETFAAHPHNSFLLLASEWGLPAFFVLILLGASALTALYQKDREAAKNMEKPYLLMGLTGALLGGGLMLSIDGLPLMPAGQMMLCLIAGLLFTQTCILPTAGSLILSSKRFNTGLMISLLVAAAFMIWGIFPLLFHLPALTFQYLSACSFNCALSPNYWSQGFIQFY